MRGAKTVQLEKSMALCVQTADALLGTQRQENQKLRSVCSCFDSSIENSKVETGWKPQYTAILYRARTGFSLCTNSHREKPVFITGNPCSHCRDPVFITGNSL